jgi:malate synthase
MEDMATGEIRLSILWEWVHKAAVLSEDDPETGTNAGDIFSVQLFKRLLGEEYKKLLNADTRDVYDSSKNTTLPIAKEIAEVYVLNEKKVPWFIDLLNINLNNTDLELAKSRIKVFMDNFNKDGSRITGNLDLV